MESLGEQFAGREPEDVQPEELIAFIMKRLHDAGVPEEYLGKIH
jgi:hypothetical protein